MALGMLVPQTASAYKYYVTFTDGTQVMFRANSPEQAQMYFDAHFGEYTILSKRPGGGYISDHIRLKKKLWYRLYGHFLLKPYYMKYIITLFSIFNFLVVSSQTNNAWMTSPDGGMDHYAKTRRRVYDTAKLRVFYKLQFRKDSTKTDDCTESQTTLMVSDRYIVFCDYNQLAHDSITDFMAASKQNARNEKAKEFWEQTINKINFECTMLKTLETSTITMQMSSVLHNYEYTMQAPEISWKLENGDSIINNIPCKKATCSYAGRNYIAWYAESVSLPYGPYVFGGLPGLIIELHDIKNNWIFTCNGIEEAKSLRDMYLYEKKWIGKGIIKTTREKALAAYRNDVEDFSNLSIEIFKVKKYVNGKWVSPEANEPRRPSNMLELEW